MSLSYENVTVFCGSRSGNDPAYAHAAGQLGHAIGRRNVHIIYGGGDNGLMGEFSRAAHCEGAEITAVIPEAFIKTSRFINPRFTLVKVQNLFERKNRMVFDADMMVALPGGIGTFDENFEVLAFNDLEKYNAPDQPLKPLILVNIRGHFNGMKDMMERAIETGFMDREMTRAIHWAGCVDEAMDIFDDLQLKPRPTVASLIPRR